MEAKYYADGEDAFAMKRDLTGLAEQLEKERMEARQRVHARTKAAAAQAQTATTDTV